MKKQISLSSLIAQKCTSVPLSDCLSHSILTKLISDQHWSCAFLMRLVLLFLKQAQKIASLDEVIQIGVNLIEQILIAKPWSRGTKDPNSFWPNLKRGLCFFAAEYNTKSPLVAAIYRKHLLPSSEASASANNNAAADDPLVEEFCDESNVLKEILVQKSPQ